VQHAAWPVLLGVFELLVANVRPDHQGVVVQVRVGQSFLCSEEGDPQQHVVLAGMFHDVAVKEDGELVAGPFAHGELDVARHFVEDGPGVSERHHDRFARRQRKSSLVG
jgi:hypothetical protein